MPFGALFTILIGIESTETNYFTNGYTYHNLQILINHYVAWFT